MVNAMLPTITRRQGDKSRAFLARLVAHLFLLSQQQEYSEKRHEGVNLRGIAVCLNDIRYEIRYQFARRISSYLILPAHPLYILNTEN